MKALLNKITSIISVTALLAVPQIAVLSSSASAQADIRGNACQGVTLGASDDCSSEDDQDNFNSLMKRIINIFSLVVGAISVLMIIIGGFRYIISGGDSNGVTGAKNTILYALVGLVIVLFSQVIVKFVLTQTQAK